MAIDVTVPESPGWWMDYLWRKLQAKQKRLKLLDDYRRGRPALPMASEGWQSLFLRFQRVARTNFADLIVSAPCERMAIRSIRTAAAEDDSGDELAWSIWTENHLDIDATDVHRDMLGLGEGFVSISVDDDAPADENGLKMPVICAEDPRQVITEQDTRNPRKTLAALKVFHDPAAGMDYAYLWLPGQQWVAYKQRKGTRRVQVDPFTGQVVFTPVAFSAGSFTMAPFAASAADLPEFGEPAEDGYAGPLSETYSVREVPMVRFGNRDGIGEFELHIDLIDRINHIFLQQIVIVTLQAFKQRALELADGKDLPLVDEAGNKIDYNDVFSADPGALWKLPAGAKVWESAEVNLQSILQAAKDYINQLASVTRTPFTMFSSDAVNQSAEGAQLTREGLVFKVEDRARIAGRQWAKVTEIALLFMGETDRGKPGKVIIDWLPAERYSLQEKASADASAVSLSDEQKYRIIWGMDPAEARIAVMQKNAQDLRDAALKTQRPGPPAPAAPIPPTDPSRDPAAAAAA